MLWIIRCNFHQCGLLPIVTWIFFVSISVSDHGLPVLIWLFIHACFPYPTHSIDCYSKRQHCTKRLVKFLDLVEMEWFMVGWPCFSCFCWHCEPVIATCHDQQKCCVCSIQMTHTCSHCKDKDGKPLYCHHPKDGYTCRQTHSTLPMAVAWTKLRLKLRLQPFSLPSCLVLDCSCTTTFYSFQY